MSSRPHHPLRQRVIALGIEGLAPADICVRLEGQVRLGHIYTILSQARAKGAEIPLHAAGKPVGQDVQGMRLQVTGPQRLARLTAAAKRRGISAGSLVQRIVNAVLDDDLVEAVLEE